MIERRIGDHEGTAAEDDSFGWSCEGKGRRYWIDYIRRKRSTMGVIEGYGAIA